MEDLRFKSHFKDLVILQEESKITGNLEIYIFSNLPEKERSDFSFVVLETKKI